MDGAALIRQTYRKLDLVGFLANGLGGTAVFAFVAFLVPRTTNAEEYETLLLRGGIAYLAFMAAAIPLGRSLTARRFYALTGWLEPGRAASEQERRDLLRYPLYFLQVSGFFWLLGGVLLGAVNATVSVRSGVGIALASVFGGTVACALQYLLVERIMRPLTARALGSGAPPDVDTPGVAARLTMAWALATGVPLLGVTLLFVAELMGADFPEGQLLGATLALVNGGARGGPSRDAAGRARRRRSGDGGGARAGADGGRLVRRGGTSRRRQRDRACCRQA